MTTFPPATGDPSADDSGAVLMIVDSPAQQRPKVGEGFHREEPNAPQLRVDDLGATRGDGIFETIGVFARAAIQLEPHLRRLQRSADLLELPALRMDVWRAAINAAIDAATHPDLSVKVVLTRGVEAAGAATGWVLAYPAPDATQARTQGLSVVTLSRGYASDIAQTAPWLLQGAKTTSYAVQMAALREAKRRGGQDVIFTSTDSYVLEGPTSTVVLRDDANRLVTPATDQGILAGTTQELLFEFAAEHGVSVKARPVPVAELDQARQVWLCSSVRLCVPVRAINERSLPIDTELPRQFAAYLRPPARP